MTDHPAHKIFFSLNEHVGIAVLSEIMREFRQVPETTEYYGDCAFFLYLDKESTEYLMEQFGWAIVSIQDFDQENEEGDYVCGSNCED